MTEEYYEESIKEGERQVEDDLERNEEGSRLGVVAEWCPSRN